jgi:hypothetical protein
VEVVGHTWVLLGIARHGVVGHDRISIYRGQLRGEAKAKIEKRRDKASSQD